MKEYKIAKGWALFIYLTAPLLIALFTWTLTFPFLKGDFSPNMGWILVPVSVAMIGLGVIGVIDTYKSKIIISDNKVISIGVFTHRELGTDEIKGYTINEQYIFIEPISDNKKRIKINKYFGKFDEITTWLAERFPELHVLSRIDEEREILNNETLGWTTEIRAEKLSNARKLSGVINWTSGIVAAWALFYPTPYQYAIISAIAIPIVALVLVKLSKGVIRIDEKKGTAYPSVGYSIMLSSMGLLARSVFDFNIFEYTNVWTNSVAITLALLGILMFKQTEFTFKKNSDYLAVFGLTLFFFCYSFGTTIHVNCFYDNSEAEIYKAKVMDKRISSGKTTSFYLKLSPWGKRQEIEEVDVERSLYQKIQSGEEVSVHFRNGKLGVPWFTVTD